METQEKTTARIYVGTYGKYNSGSLRGAWVELSDFLNKDDFYQHIKELHSDEEDPEFMFQDFEGFPRRLYNEAGGIEDIYEYLDMISELSDDELEAFEVYIELGNDADIDEFRESFMGYWDSERAFAENLADELGYYDAMKNAGISSYYFDEDAFSRDLFMSDYTYSNGFVFMYN